MRKRILSVFWVAVLMGVLLIRAMAAEPRAVTANPKLRFNGTTAECSIVVKGESSQDDLDVTLTLYQGSNSVDSWSNSGTGIVTIKKECRVVSGKSYKLTAEYSVNGKKMSATSTSGVCP